MQGDVGLILGQEPKISHATGQLTLCATPSEAPALQQRPNTAKEKKKKKGNKMVAECGPCREF